jgi:hypothetical protein
MTVNPERSREMPATRWIGSVVMLMLVLGCAGPREGGAPAGAGGGALGEPVTIDNLGRVAGRWAGLIDLSEASETDQHIDLDVQSDGNYRATSARTIGFMDTRGTMRVSEGRLLVQGDRGARGRGTLFSGAGQPTLVLDMTLPDGRVVSARLHPQR